MTTNRQIYDSKIIYPETHPLNIEPNIITTFHIPSSRYFYYTLDAKHVIPYLASGDSDQTKRDVAAWIGEGNFPTVYALLTVDSVSPEVDIISIQEGNRVRVNSPQKERYLRQFEKFFT